MGAPLSEDYEALRTIVKGKNYELIYSALLNEVINIKKVGVDVKDIEGVEKYVQNKVRELIFSSKGLPTYLIRLSILIGPVFEKDLSFKVSTYLITYYSSDFQLFISKNFKTLKSVSLLYKELETIVKNFENKFFNLPTEWKILPEVMRSLYLIVKQKLCDYFYFEDIQNDDYYKAFTVVLSEEKKINKYIMLSDETNIFLTNLNEKALNVKALNDKNSNNKTLNDKDSNEKASNVDFYNLNEDPYVHMLFKLFIPHIEIYLDEYFKLYNNPQFDVKDNEIKIFTPFLSVFRSFEKLYPKITYFGNESATKSLLEHVNNLITKMIDNCNNQISNKIEVLYELEESEEARSPEHLRSIIEMIIIVLNTSEYIYEYISEFCNTLSTNYNSFKELDGFNNSLGSLEKNFTQHLSTYISHILANVDFDKEDFSTDLIQNLEKYVFDMKFTEIHDDIKKLLIESIVIYILSSLYLIDFDVDKAEIYLGELSQIKTYLSKYSQSIPLFGVLECYIKIFLCPSDDVVKFVDNFLLLSNDIFSLDQIVCSLTCTNTIEDLKNEYLRRADKKNLELENDEYDYN